MLREDITIFDCGDKKDAGCVFVWANWNLNEKLEPSKHVTCDKTTTWTQHLRAIVTPNFTGCDGRFKSLQETQDIILGLG